MLFRSSSTKIDEVDRRSKNRVKTYGQFAWYEPLLMMMDDMGLLMKWMVDGVGRKWSC